MTALYSARTYVFLVICENQVLFRAQIHPTMSEVVVVVVGVVTAAAVVAAVAERLVLRERNRKVDFQDVHVPSGFHARSGRDVPKKAAKVTPPRTTVYTVRYHTHRENLREKHASSVREQTCREVG